MEGANGANLHNPSLSSNLHSGVSTGISNAVEKTTPKNFANLVDNLIRGISSPVKDEKKKNVPSERSPWMESRELKGEDLTEIKETHSNLDDADNMVEVDKSRSYNGTASIKSEEASDEIDMKMGDMDHEMDESDATLPSLPSKSENGLVVTGEIESTDETVPIKCDDSTGEESVAIEETHVKIEDEDHEVTGTKSEPTDEIMSCKSEVSTAIEEIPLKIEDDDGDNEMDESDTMIPSKPEIAPVFLPISQPDEMVIVEKSESSDRTKSIKSEESIEVKEKTVLILDEVDQEMVESGPTTQTLPSKSGNDSTSLRSSHGDKTTGAESGVSQHSISVSSSIEASGDSNEKTDASENLEIGIDPFDAELCGIVTDETVYPKYEDFVSGMMFERGALVIPDLSPIKCPIKTKRVKVEIEESDEEDLIQEIEKIRYVPTPSPFPPPFTHPDVAANHGMVSIHSPLSIIMGEVRSKVVVVKSMPFSLYVRIEQNEGSVSVFLQCASRDSKFLVPLSIDYRMHHPTDQRKDLCKTCHHTFDHRQNDWGFKNYCPKSEIHNFVDSQGTLRVSCVFQVGQPQGMRFLDDSVRSPVGLFNQGSTCYLNVTLQVLFATKILRKAILKLEYSERSGGAVKALQKLFYQMHTSIETLVTTDLTNSFGWNNTSNVNAEHDAQEMMKILMDKIEIAFKGTQNEHLMDDLFKTKTRTFIKCLDVEYESGRDEECSDIQLPVSRSDDAEGSYDILSALRDFTRTEIMDGPNKYHAEQFGLQRAEKGQRFVSFPKILHIQLLRFQLDFQSMNYVKLNDRVEFPKVLDLSEFVEGDEKRRSEFVLHGVICHCGGVGSGHYISYICKFPGAEDPKWFRFDDAAVTEMHDPDNCVLEKNFGKGSDQSGSFNAYMLVYVRRDAIEEVFCDVKIDEMAVSLRESIKKEEEKERWEAINKERISKITFILEPDTGSTRIWEHYDYVEWMMDGYVFGVKKDAAGIVILHEAQKKAAQGDVRLWMMKRRIDKGGLTMMKVTREIERDEMMLQMKRAVKILDAGFFSQSVIFIMRNRPLRWEGEEEIDERMLNLVFFKWYNSDIHSSVYITSYLLPSKIILAQLSESLCRAASLPPWSQLRYWKEESLHSVELLNDMGEESLNMGDVIVFEGIHMVEEGEKNIETVMDDSRRIFMHCIYLSSSKRSLYGMMENEGGVNEILIEGGFTSTFRSLAEELGERLNHPPEKIAMWNREKLVDTKMLDDIVGLMDMGGIDGDPRVPARAQLGYCRLMVDLSDAEKMRGVRTNIRLKGRIHDSRDLFLRITPHVLREFKDRMYEMCGREKKLRFVWKYRTSLMGNFLYREFEERENMKEMFEDYKPDSLAICVDEMEEEEEDYDDEDKVVVPLVFIEIKSQIKTLATPTLFLKISPTAELYQLKLKVEQKMGMEPNWQDLKLIVFCGCRCISMERKPSLNLKQMYKECKEDTRGMDRGKETKLVLALMAEFISQSTSNSNISHPILTLE